MTTDPGSGTPMPSPHEPAPPTAAGTAPPSGGPPPGRTAGEESTSDLLQSMLSRAVEGQVSDQRELTGAVNDMRSQLMRLSQELAEMRVRPPQDEGSDAQINNVTVEMREAVRFLSERLDGVTRMVAQRGEELADIRTALTAIDAHVRSQAETIGVLSAGLQSLPSYGERVSVLQDNLQVLHRQLVGIEEAITANADDSGTTERLAAIDASLTPLAQQLAAIDASLTPLAQRFGAIESSLTPLAQRFEAIESSLTPLAQRLDEVSEVGTAQSALLSQLQNSSSQVQQAVAGLHEKVAPIAAGITSINSQVGGLAEAAPAAASLDPEVAESINAAVSETEQRLAAHIDEAVLALAQTLLKRRPPTSASQITGTPIVAEPEAADVASMPAVGREWSASTGDAPADVPSAWWEREIGVGEPAEQEAAAAEETDGEPVEEADGDPSDLAGASTQVPVLDEETDEETAETADEEGEPEGPPIEAAEAAEADEPDEAAESVPEASGATDGMPEAVADAEGEGEEEPEGSAVPWEPQIPPERNPVDPTITLDDGKKKRFWGRH